MRGISILLLPALAALISPWALAENASGTVYADANGNGARDSGERGLAGVLVSNGREVAATGGEGRWTLPAGDDTAFFVIKPSGFAMPVDGCNRARFFYLHKPAGSPSSSADGVAPTGPLPASIDFPLIPKPEAGRFDVILFADTQARGLAEADYVARDVVPELIGTDAAFGVNLGDIVADDPALFREVSAAEGQAGIPWWHVFGNHDHDRGATGDQYADETFERWFGPPTYAFMHGDVVFIAFKNIAFDASGKSENRFSDQDIGFVRNLLQFVPPEKLVVMMMHVPLHAVKNVREMSVLFAKHPRTFSIAGHIHEQFHVFMDAKKGWMGGGTHHHYAAGAVSGSWWCGEPDETGIPHALMNDGTPNGYAVLSFDGADYRLRWKCARRPADYQMNLYMPNEAAAAALPETGVLVNFFAGSDRCKLEMRAGPGGAWTPMEQTRGVDPECARMNKMNPFRHDGVWGWDMDEPSATRHLWKALLPAGLAPGTHTVSVRATDQFGQVFYGHRLIRVTP